VGAVLGGVSCSRGGGEGRERSGCRGGRGGGGKVGSEGGRVEGLGGETCV